MTQFQDREFRHFCRNTKCRSKLKTPVSNKREAFCARGCHTAFYRKRCLVCEGPIERNRDDQKICGKAMCRRAWRARTGFGRYIGSIDLQARKSWCESNDPDFASKAADVVGLYIVTKLSRSCGSVNAGSRAGVSLSSDSGY